VRSEGTPAKQSASARRKWTPHPYQVKAMRWLLSHGGAGLFLDPGLGKTSITLGALKVLKREGMLRQGALVICPLDPLYNVWDGDSPDSEIRKWSDFEGMTTSLLHGPDKLEALRAKADIYLINPEGLQWLMQHLGRRRFDVLVVDESTTFKHANTERFKLLRPLLPTFARRWILTGTPSPNGLIDLFGQIYILDLGNALGAYITWYRRSYFDEVGQGIWVLRDEKAEQRIYRRIEPLILRMSETDYLKLPPLVGALTGAQPSIIKVAIPAKARKHMDQLEELFFAELEEGSITAVNAAVKSMKLRQAANGGVYLDAEPGARGPRKWAHLHDAKTDAVVRLLDQMGGRQAAIAVEFHHDVERLRMNQRLRNTPAIGEGTKREDRALVADWNRGRLPEVIVNPASFSRGTNAQQGGDALIFHSLGYNFEHYWQLIKRFWRQERKRPFFVHHVIAENSADLATVASLRSKNSTQRGLLDALRAYSLRRPKRSHSGD
jgi:SNF2 family DNA or RNA helicase